MSYKVSVIVPVYNVENYLAECLESILAQTLRDIEIICINDGSRDKSKEILEKYQALDDRVVVVNKVNGGYGCACNTGLRLARGEYLSIVESDDFIDSNMFEDLYNLAVENRADIVKSAFYEYSECEGKVEDRKINWSEQYKMPQSACKIKDCPQFLYFHPSIWSCLYRREFLQAHGISFVEAKGAGWADNPFQVQTLCLAQKIVYTDKPYYHYRLTNPTSSSNVVNMSNPFNRSDEVHAFLDENKVCDKNLLAHLYKREFSYIDIVLGGVTAELFDLACEKIFAMTSRMKKEIIEENDFVNDYEKWVYGLCKTKSGIETLMNDIRSRRKGVQVV